MTKPLLIIQNDPKEGAGLLASLIRERGFRQESVLGDKADYTALKSENYGGLVILGGAQSAYETESYPFLEREMELCKAFIGAGKPVAGFCLGAQIIAYALGGRVHPGAQKEIGWFNLYLTEEASQDSLLAGHPPTLLAYHFHGDVIEAPPGAVNLAYSDLTECQLFKVGKSAYGFQYHAEVDLPLIQDMCANNASYMAANGFDPQAVVRDSKEHIADFVCANAKILENWLNIVRAA
jgi:GMP synthase (glutamine-hydrolysing)